MESASQDLLKTARSVATELRASNLTFSFLSSDYECHKAICSLLLAGPASSVTFNLPFPGSQTPAPKESLRVGGPLWATTRTVSETALENVLQAYATMVTVAAKQTLRDLTLVEGMLRCCYVLPQTRPDKKERGRALRRATQRGLFLKSCLRRKPRTPNWPRAGCIQT